MRIALAQKFFIVSLLCNMSFYIPARAAELVMFWDAACPWCAQFDHEIGPIYQKTHEGRRAPLRRINISEALPADLSFINVERLTPLFVLIHDGKEIGRIRGYPGEDHFWGLLGVLLARLDARGTLGEKVISVENSLHGN